MKWERMRKPLTEGFQVFRTSWPEATYVVLEDNWLTEYSAAHPEGVPFEASRFDLAASDWAATGLSGE